MQVTEPVSSPWQASLALGFARRGDSTILVRRDHRGPLRVQKALYPEGPGVCHAIVLHPPAGIAGGDQLDIRIEADAASHSLLTTPGAGKWYRSSGAQSSQQVRLRVGAGAKVEWLPQESIVFSGAQATMRTTVELEQEARFVGVETICFGRRASGETFDKGSLRLATDIRYDGRLLWRERGLIDGGSPLLDSPIGLAGYSICSTVLAAGVELTAEALAACRVAGSREVGAQWGVSLLPQLLVGRYLGHSAEAAREWLMQLWAALRPAMSGREAIAPRIWNT
ncbi:MAG: urease accessory protein UreD [Rhodocyclales bacterium]|nr:urease accessory protein UreD [Rhodocyclales bacterium]